VRGAESDHERGRDALRTRTVSITPGDLGDYNQWTEVIIDGDAWSIRPPPERQDATQVLLWVERRTAVDKHRTGYRTRR
jgi:hypothetical protein